MKGFLAGSESRRTSDKNQQQFARILLGCGVAAFLFTLLYRKDAGTAFTALAQCTLPGRAAGRYADLRHAHAFDAAQCRADRRGHPRLEGYPTAGPCERAAGHGAGSFPQRVHYAARHQCPVRKEDIELAIIYSASMLADVNTPLKDIFLGMTGDNRKLLCKVENLETLDGLGYVGWINGERVMIGSRPADGYL